MNIRKLTDTLSVSPQIAATDLPALQAAGVRAIVCNRPDGASADKPAFDEPAAAARELGREARNLPVERDGIDHA
ncbi:beta-lactamase hydrolase domain-containing protein, partial [Burkholderia vietnamiensis]|uniref:beta-lactamase hydrolase domain-containing protein n=1 Tax=Burkholderia vietnamiensis TaxID=60552 RepID=UPI002096B41A